MVNPTPANGWTTTDGKFFTDYTLAGTHQNELDFKAWCSDNICVGGEWSADMVARAILDNWLVMKRSS